MRFAYLYYYNQGSNLGVCTDCVSRVTSFMRHQITKHKHEAISIPHDNAQSIMTQ